MAATSWADPGLVFPNTKGKIRRRDSVMRSLRRFLEEAGLPAEVRFHDLRHTCLTLLLNLGTRPHIAQAIARHSHVDVTMMIYAHSGMTEQTEALRKLGEAFGGTD